MKIFYAVQATGNGHVSRAQQLYPYLQKFGEVDFFISGNNANLDFKLPKERTFSTSPSICRPL